MNGSQRLWVRLPGDLAGGNLARDVTDSHGRCPLPILVFVLVRVFVLVGVDESV